MLWVAVLRAIQARKKVEILHAAALLLGPADFVKFVMPYSANCVKQMLLNRHRKKGTVATLLLQLQMPVNAHCPGPDNANSCRAIVMGVQLLQCRLTLYCLSVASAQGT